MSPSKYVLRYLADYFKSNECRNEVIRKIDYEINNNEKTLDEFLLDLCIDLKDIFVTKKIGLYGIKNDMLLQLQESRNERYKILQEPSIPQNSTLSEKIHGKPFLLYRWPNSDEDNTNLLLPIFLEKIPLYIIIIQDDLTREASHLESDENKEFATILFEQLKILIGNKKASIVNKAKNELLLKFFDDELQPFKCWNTIANSTSKYLPNWEPFKIEPLPLAQILTYNKDDKYLMLQASQKGEVIREEKLTSDRKSQEVGSMEKCFEGPIPLKVDDTICGIAIKKGVDVLLVNPESEKEKYKSFLFSSGYPKSELVLTVRNKGKIRALINLEHMKSDIFHEYHIEILKDFAGFLAPFIDALISRERRQKQKQTGILYTVTNLLEKMGKTYEHKIGQSLIKSRMATEKLEKGLKGLNVTDSTVLGHLRDLSIFISEFQDRSNSFLTGMPEYIQKKAINIYKAIEGAINEFDPDRMWKNDRIKFELELSDEQPYVYASEMLKEHIYNLISNSIDAIKKSIDEKRIEKGIIKITMNREKVEDYNKKETPLERISITIKDNGGGVEPHIFERIFEYSFSTKRKSGGTGFGLPAAREYMQTMGGNLDAENNYPHGLTIYFYLEEYSHEYHSKKDADQEDEYLEGDEK